MDVDSLRAELEKHLAKNPDERAPHGFRDRFNAVVEQYQADGGSIPKSALETELEQIRKEAEAAANAAVAAREEAPADPAPRAEAVSEPVPDPVPAPAAAPAAAPTDPPDPGFLQRYGLVLIVALIALAALYYFFLRR